MPIISLDRIPEKRMSRKTKLMLMDREAEVKDSTASDGGSGDECNNNINNDDDDKFKVIINDPAPKSGEIEIEKKLVRVDWLPWWDLLTPKGYTVENIDDFKDRHCGNCARGMRATSMRKKSMPMQGCGIAARVKDVGGGYVRVISHCSGAEHDYPEGWIKKNS